MIMDPTKWGRLVPGRLEKVTDALRILARTGAKDYEPISPEHAEEMLEIVDQAVGELKAAYAPYVTNKATSVPEAPPSVASEPSQTTAPRPTAAPLAEAPDDPIRIAWFVNRIPKEHLPAWAAHLASRVTDEFYEAFEKKKQPPKECV